MQKQNIKTVAVILILLSTIASAWLIWQCNSPQTQLSGGNIVSTADTYVDANKSCSANLTLLSATAASEPVLTENEYRMISITAVNADFTNDESLLSVIRVIYNRVHDDRFPDTVEGVLRQRRQFENCDKVALYAREAYDYEHIRGLINKVWIDGADPFDGANAIFYSDAGVPSRKIAKGLTLVCVYGGTAFYSQD